MIWQTVNFRKLSIWLLPTFLRRSKQIAWLNALISPVIDLYENILYKMQHNGQVMYLEKVLNEKYKVAGYNPNLHRSTRKIIIVDAYYAKRNYLYQDYEQKPIYLGSKFIHQNTEYTAEYFDFIIQIPATIIVNENELKSIMAYYKLAGKKYKIEYI